MTLEQVQGRVESIRSGIHDNESAHAEEDSLWEDVLEHIAKGGRNAKAIAAAALETRNIDFTRWYA